MKARTALGVIAAGGVAVVVAIATVPAWAAPTGPGPGTGTGAPGAHVGHGDHGTRARDGSCLTAAGVVEPSGTLTEAQRSALAANAQEEKLAHDLYTEFANLFETPVFDRIAASETGHLSAIRALLTRYGVADPTADREPGRFTDPVVQARYDELLVRGRAGEQAALEVGRTVESEDIELLDTSLGGLTAPDVQRVYSHLLHASQHHLAAFERWLTR